MLVPYSLQKKVPSVEPHPTQENTSDDQWEPHDGMYIIL